MIIRPVEGRDGSYELLGQLRDEQLPEAKRFCEQYALDHPGVHSIVVRRSEGDKLEFFPTMVDREVTVEKCRDLFCNCYELVIGLNRIHATETELIKMQRTIRETVLKLPNYL